MSYLDEMKVVNGEWEGRKSLGISATKPHPSTHKIYIDTSKGTDSTHQNNNCFPISNFHSNQVCGLSVGFALASLVVEIPFEYMNWQGLYNVILL